MLKCESQWSECVVKEGEEKKHEEKHMYTNKFGQINALQPPKWCRHVESICAMRYIEIERCECVKRQHI